jgi:hypothetical protein
MWYIFPDFFFKTFYGTIFIDSGFAFNRDDPGGPLALDRARASYGFGARVHTFILQLYPLLLNLQVARPFDSSASILYLTAGTSF